MSSSMQLQSDLKTRKCLDVFKMTAPSAHEAMFVQPPFASVSTPTDGEHTCEPRDRDKPAAVPLCTVGDAVLGSVLQERLNEERLGLWDQIACPCPLLYEERLALWRTRMPLSKFVAENVTRVQYLCDNLCAMRLEIVLSSTSDLTGMCLRVPLESAVGLCFTTQDIERADVLHLLVYYGLVEPPPHL